jgi:hypothetical protein
MNLLNIENFDAVFPVSVCWQCGDDMSFCPDHREWECDCGFTLNEGFCQISHVTVECFTLIGDFGLAKLKNKRGWRLLGLQHSGK